MTSGLGSVHVDGASDDRAAAAGQQDMRAGLPVYGSSVASDIWSENHWRDDGKTLAARASRQ